MEIKNEIEIEWKNARVKECWGREYKKYVIFDIDDFSSLCLLQFEIVISKHGWIIYNHRETWQNWYVSIVGFVFLNLVYDWGIKCAFCP